MSTATTPEALSRAAEMRLQLYVHMCRPTDGNPSCAAVTAALSGGEAAGGVKA